MAKAQIGAVIGIEGATKFSQDMKTLARETKLFNSEMKALTSSFDKNTLSLQNVSQKREILNKLLSTTQERLQKQKEALDKVNAAVGDETISDQKWTETQQKLQTEINETTAEVNRLEQEIKDLPNAAKLVTDAWRNATSDWGELFKGIGSAMTKYITVPLAGAAVYTTKTAADFESAFTGVTKTVDEMVDANGNVIYSYEQLNEQLHQIPLNTASTYESVAAVAEAAGQLAVPIDLIPKFTEAVIMLGDTTNISAEEAAVSMAQFFNIMGDGTESVDAFGGSLVALGNNTATDEASILRLATRLASAGHIVGMTTPEILGLAAAMSSVGLTAEAGGTAMSQTMTKISKAVANGGETLELFGEITNRTGQEFADLWRNDPIQAIQEFLIGLSSLEGGSEELILMLDELGFSGIRESDTLRRLASDYDGVTAAVELATQEYKGYNKEAGETNALLIEAEKRYGTFDSKVSQLKESFRLFSSEVGETIKNMLKPAVEGLATMFQNLATWWKGLSEPARQLIIVIGGIVAAIGPLLLIIGNVLIFASKIKAALAVFGGLSAILAPVTAALTSFGTTLVGIATGPVGIIAAAIAALVIGCKALGLTWEDVVEALKGTWEALKIATQEAVDMVLGFFRNLSDEIGNKINNIVSNVGNGIAQVKEGIIRDFNTAKTNALTIWENMKSGISAKVNQINTAISNGINGAVNYIRSLISQAWSWGADLVSNIANGISSSIGKVINAISNVGSKIRGYLGFSEPDEGPLSNFHTYMPDMMKLMAQGINDNMYLVEDALSNVSNMMATNLEGQGKDNISYGGVTINLNVPQGTDGKTLVDQIETEIANRTMRRRMVFN